jgi:hypothetical protein
MPKNQFGKVRQDKTSLNRIQKNSSHFTALKNIVFLDTAHHGLSRLEWMPRYSALKSTWAEASRDVP